MAVTTIVVVFSVTADIVVIAVWVVSGEVVLDTAHWTSQQQI